MAGKSTERSLLYRVFFKTPDAEKKGPHIAHTEHIEPEQQPSNQDLQPPEALIIYCTKCGQKKQEHFRFCVKCGNKLS